MRTVSAHTYGIRGGMVQVRQDRSKDMAQHEIVTADELARRMQLRPQTIREWARSGKIPCMRPTGKTVRFDFDRVLKALSDSRDRYDGANETE